MEAMRHYASPLGWITMTGDGEALTGLWFDGQKHAPDVPGAGLAERDLPVFAQTEGWLDRYFCGWEPDFTPPLRWKGTPFRGAVWELLRTVPYGRTVTYGELAARLAASGWGRTSARAVGGAVSRNPIALIVPCHRVVGAGGVLTGYAGGLERKACLLELEGIKRAAK